MTSLQLYLNTGSLWPLHCPWSTEYSWSTAVSPLTHSQNCILGLGRSVEELHRSGFRRNTSVLLPILFYYCSFCTGFSHRSKPGRQEKKNTFNIEVLFIIVLIIFELFLKYFSTSKYPESLIVVMLLVTKSNRDSGSGVNNSVWQIYFFWSHTLCVIKWNKNQNFSWRLMFILQAGLDGSVGLI